MNREIKFRAWDRALNKMITKENVKGLLDTVNTGDWDTDYTYSRDEWYPAYDILTIFDYFEGIQDRYIEDTSTKRFELMQYTGLHDKNGKEIYEGDIVRQVSYKYSNDEYGHKGFYENISKVLYKGRAFQYEWIRTNGIEMPKDFKESFIEVIGNIYDNPELLGGK